ncbi:ATP-grasp domain-containing protein [Candidatus Woesearchaeota archaeon]|nr:ATP-grasp domain-containing protein [Candidatus Woesearchaeota archaeon]
MQKRLLVIGGGPEMVPLFSLTKQMGLQTVVTDRDPHAPGFLYADDHILASTRDIKETVEKVLVFHAKKPIHGVMTIANDVPLTVASVARVLHLPEIPPLEIAEILSDKFKMKEVFKASGIPLPWFQQITTFKELQQIVHERGFPLVLKPVDNCGGRGVFRLTSVDNLQEAFSTAQTFSRRGTLLVEAFLEGPQVSTESIVYHGRVYTIGFSDRNYEFLEKYAPHFIENGGELPSHLSPADQRKMYQLLEKTAQALHLTNGVLKGDLILHNGEAKIIEVAGRLSGGYFCTHETPLSTGIEIVVPVIKMALGEKVDEQDLKPKYHRGVCQRYFFPTEGKVVAVEGIDQVKKLPWVKLFSLNVKIGDIIKKPVDSNASVGVIMTIGETREEALERMAEAMAHIKIKTIKQTL